MMTRRRHISKKTMLSLFLAADGVCAVCGTVVTPETVSVDHVVPVSRGGNDDEDNLQLVHRRCNTSKSNLLPDEYRLLRPTGPAVAKGQRTSPITRKINLRDVRERKLLTQEELAQRSGLTQTTISAIEVGRHEPRISTVRRLAKALEVEPEELMSHVDGRLRDSK